MDCCTPGVSQTRCRFVLPQRGPILRSRRTRKAGVNPTDSFSVPPCTGCRHGFLPRFRIAAKHTDREPVRDLHRRFLQAVSREMRVALCRLHFRMPEQAPDHGKALPERLPDARGIPARTAGTLVRRSAARREYAPPGAGEVAAPASAGGIGKTEGLRRTRRRRRRSARTRVLVAAAAVAAAAIAPSVWVDAKRMMRDRLYALEHTSCCSSRRSSIRRASTAPSTEPRTGSSSGAPAAFAASAGATATATTGVRSGCSSTRCRAPRGPGCVRPISTHLCGMEPRR